MKKGDILEGIVTRVDYPGKGVVETSEGICIVKNVLPGQRVSLRVSKKRRGKAEGMLLEVIEKAPLERTAPCPHFGRCGGCIYLHLPFEKELELKKSQVERLLQGAVAEGAKLSGIPVEEIDVSGWFEGILPCPATSSAGAGCREPRFRQAPAITPSSRYLTGRGMARTSRSTPRLRLTRRSLSAPSPKGR